VSEDSTGGVSESRSLTDLDGSVEDTRSLFDDLFGDGDDAVVDEVLERGDGPPTAATRAIDPDLPSRRAPAARATAARSSLAEPTVAEPKSTPDLAAGASDATVAAAAPAITEDEFTVVEDEPDTDAEEAEPKVRRPKRGRVRARKVKRIIRHIEPWSVLKVSLFFFLTIWLILLVAGLLIWSVAVNAGGVTSVEDFIEKLMGYEDFSFLPEQIFRAYALGGLVVCVALAALSVISTLVFNLISDLMGGIRVTVIEEERVRR